MTERKREQPAAGTGYHLKEVREGPLSFAGAENEAPGKCLGQWGEELAAAWLAERGYRILERNFRCRSGEIDLVALEGDCLVFVEVKSRRSLSFGSPCEGVTGEKRRRLLQTARYYCMLRRPETRLMRMDVVEILRRDGKSYIRHIRDAFGE
ncbi:MAG: YraN family protein [Bacillota bacterium]|nr:YraN family protein [Bacillota bacterium]